MLRDRHAKCEDAHMPWLSNTLLQDLDSLARLACRQPCTAPSLPRSLRHSREASREQACCSCGLPAWPCAKMGAFERPPRVVSVIVARNNSLRDIGGSKS